ncbi:MAG: hypothetical protein QOJ42_2254 [Acidobacteriaceae bacterium]|nr:hypothetical protein [Acidobacteriaceae bacterium]
MLYPIEYRALALKRREAADRSMNDKIMQGNLCQRYSGDVR